MVTRRMNINTGIIAFWPYKTKKGSSNPKITPAIKAYLIEILILIFVNILNNLDITYLWSIEKNRDYKK